jgi:hypothetical protein
VCLADRYTEQGSKHMHCKMEDTRHHITCWFTAALLLAPSEPLLLLLLMLSSSAALQECAKAVRRSVGLCSSAIMGHNRCSTASRVGTWGREQQQWHSRCVSPHAAGCSLIISDFVAARQQCTKHWMITWCMHGTQTIGSLSNYSRCLVLC